MLHCDGLLRLMPEFSGARGVLIAFEGGDGSGKSTQARLLSEQLDAVLTRQAGGTAFGERVRELTLDPRTAHVSERAEALLYMADRAEHVDELVEPALNQGRHVVSDRWAYSTLVYQGYVGGLDIDELRRIANWAMHDLWPDIVVLLQVPLEVGERRMSHRGGEADHYESAGIEARQRLDEGFLRLASQEPDRWRVVDGTGTVEEVAARVWSVVAPALNRAV